MGSTGLDVFFGWISTKYQLEGEKKDSFVVLFQLLNTGCNTTTVGYCPVINIPRVTEPKFS